MELNTDIQYIKGVGPKRAKIIKKELGIETVKDLIEYFPYRYEDRTKVYSLASLQLSKANWNNNIQVAGKIIGDFQLITKGRKRLTVKISDGTGEAILVWFQGFEWIKKKISYGKKILIFGKPNFYKNEISFIHPEIEDYNSEQIKTKKLAPVYPSKEKLKENYITNKVFIKIFSTLLPEIYEKIQETLPVWLIEKYGLLPRKDAILNIHLPQSVELANKARYRLKFEELFWIQLKIQQRRLIRKNKVEGYVFEKVGDIFHKFYKENLPFELTGAQKRVIKDIHKDFKSGKQMNRLLQGDVGSGKTLVALLSMLIAIDNGYQVALMAPTEVLAQQHYQSFVSMLQGIPVNIALLTGSTTQKNKTIIKKQLAEGNINIIIGTHALIEDDVVFNKLGFVVIDEQHRFGVAQRAKMWTKSIIPPHILVMTATPIPRTLAMTLYGDLDVSIIDEMPPGRKHIDTYHVTQSQRAKVYNFIKKQIDKGRQAYIVFPLIEESAKLELENLMTGYEDIIHFFPSPKYLTAMVHGKMLPKEKEEQMRLFVSGQAQIMVATTVIEVGVNVPNATIMVIENAERFGLSQLHQLRGRVGRSSHKSYCILITKGKLSKTAENRMQIMTATNDGFQIAEEDLRLRGPGNIEGKQQSGMPFELKIAELGKDGILLNKAKNVAIEVLKEDLLLEKDKNILLKKQLENINFKEIDWSRIS